MTTPDPDNGTLTGTLLAEDLLLLLFQPDSGTIAGEGTLFYVLGGAVLAELAQFRRVSIEDAGLRGQLVHAEGDTPPQDAILAHAWEYVDKPRNAQTVLAAIGPRLRGPLLDRLVERGMLARTRGTVLGVFPTEKIELRDAAHRAGLVAAARAALVDGSGADARTASLIALLSASGSLPSLDREIPWTSDVATRARQFEQGDQSAGAAGEAVVRTMTAVTANAVSAAIAASVISPR